MYNIIIVHRDGDHLTLRREIINKSPMHKSAAIQWAKIQAKKRNISYDDGTWRRYECTKSPLNSTIELQDINY